jgi:hypothetical protein
MGWDGIGTLLGKVSTFIPGRVEQMKNEKERLINERKNLLDGPPSVKSVERLIVINKRLSEINSILGNKASD